ncbi:MAG: carboxypeptidase M32 [Thermotogaceae bacterium]|nr:carboxypeptidase M32 [Thermotogaceae bacterium]
MEKLKKKYRWIYHFQSALNLIEWDFETHMPRKAFEKRAEAIGTISTFVFQYLTSDELGGLINQAEKEARTDEDRAIVYFAKKDYEKQKRIPPKLLRKFSEETAKAQAIWQEAKEKSDFSIFSDQLEKVVEIVIEIAEKVGYEKNRYDALLDFYEPGMTTEKLKGIISPLRKFLVEAVDKISSVEKPEDIFKKYKFDMQKQKELSKKVLEIMGYDFGAGRVDVSAHPFTTTISHNDVRVTTRYDVHDLKNSFYSTVHEGGHALYEQGIPEEYRGLPIGDGASMAIHESQSRFWENIVARSLPFWKFFKSIIEEYFEVFKRHSAEEVWRASNIVERSLIRTEADEVTYNLHIMLRFDLEEALINRKIKVKDLPGLWNEKMKEYIGVIPPNDREGVLQDVHWAHGTFGYFPSYMLGNLYSAQIYYAMLKDLDFEKEIEIGNFDRILSWLREKVHKKARTREPDELIKEISGEELSEKYFIRYVREKYSDLFSVSLL